MSDVEKFLLDNNELDAVFEGTYDKMKIHKEIYDDRFIVLYSKYEKNHLTQEDYSINGYFDVKDKIIYDLGYQLRNILGDRISFEKKSFSDVEKELLNDIKTYIENYSFENAKSIKKLAEKRFADLNGWEFDRYKREVRQSFIKQDNYEVSLGSTYSNYKCTNSIDYKSKDILEDYLKNPDDTVSKWANIIIKDQEEQIGFDMLIYEFKKAYLNEIKKNPNKYTDLYTNKKLYDSIKNMDAKTINITIEYNKQEMSFSFNYRSFIYDLANDYTKGSDYNSAYEKVSEFIKENTNRKEERGRFDFDFSHITKITYGKKELYKKEETVKHRSKDLER